MPPSIRQRPNLLSDISSPTEADQTVLPPQAHEHFAVEVSVVIPTYKSGDILPLLVTRLESALASATSRHEIILIDDGSPDETWNVIEHLTTTHHYLRGIRLTRNYSQHNALLCGIRAAHGAVIITMDDDLQHPPEDIQKLLTELKKGYDVVYGTPILEQHTCWRNVASQITKLALQSALGVKAGRSVSAFRAIRTSTRDCFANYQAPSVSIDVLLSWGTTNISAIPTHHAPRHSGTSNYTAGRLLSHAFNMVTGYSGVPLRLASLIGFTLTLFGIGILFYVVWNYFTIGSPVPGFPFLASIIAIFSGAQLFSIGIIGEYIARLHFRMMDRPSYCIRQQTNSHDSRAT